MDRFCGMSLRTFGWLICLAGCANCLAGCADYTLRSPLDAPGSDRDCPTARPLPAPLPNRPKQPVPAPTLPTAPAPLASGGRSPATPIDPQDMPAVLAELEALGAIDAPTRDRLVADLKKTDPALWPQLLAYFKASLAYRQKYAPGEAPAQGVDSPARPGRRQPVDCRPADRRTRAVAPRAQCETAASPRARPRLPERQPPPAPQHLLALRRRRLLAIRQSPIKRCSRPRIKSPHRRPKKLLRPPRVTPPPVDTAAAGETHRPAALRRPATAPAAGDPTAGRRGARRRCRGAAAASLPTAASPPAATVAASGNKPGSPAPAAEIDPLDWHAHLKAAIRGLERETADPPATTAAIGRHAGLRLLYLVDGDRDGALRPLPGVSATQQDFWSQQLFGLSTYLDAERTPDDARRAAAAAVHLRDANLKLGDVATLTGSQPGLRHRSPQLWGLQEIRALRISIRARKCCCTPRWKTSKARRPSKDSTLPCGAATRFSTIAVPGSIRRNSKSPRSTARIRVATISSAISSGCPNASTAAPTRCN